MVRGGGLIQIQKLVFLLNLVKRKTPLLWNKKVYFRQIYTLMSSYKNKCLSV